jgi:iron complex outermembrane receptor protein
LLYAAWCPNQPLTITPTLDIAGDRWSDVNTTPLRTCEPVRTPFSVVRNFDVVLGFRNLTDGNYELAWGFSQPGRTFFVKIRVGL